MSSVNVHQSNNPLSQALGQANEVKKLKRDPPPVNLSPDGYFSEFSNRKPLRTLSFGNFGEFCKYKAQKTSPSLI
jgi:hypothetical protein